MLSSIPFDVEVKSVVFAMNGEGAPGPDGFGGCFYQHFWDVVHIDVCNSVRQFFTQGWLLPNLNSNKVILIPKFHGADSIEDFRPIALDNFHFKIITKVIVDRLALVAPNIVSSQQRCFIKEKQILDCLCSTTEVINILGHKTCGGNMAIKINI
ncbi:putative RNA-directed DNA polymerase [Lupinus albus]|uniref:Putative RNA-directed DNA polymerase n=1 Tax=Lupinus albus TaxID=3870 RepID=A0A6A4QLM9_LUPAL|nr:putative RNA-directed DNA polymerase [Lupinus albus]